MRTSITTMAATALLLAPAAQAAELPPREVRINHERLATLPIEDQQRVLEIKDRLEAIIATDRKSLDAQQRSEMRTEWKALKSEVKQYNSRGSVLYISTGALIIIILLLIILL